ncbi:hypothetical protein RJT34_15336 [Clitoria ternatea]|uniref:Uncharacterized protein n=1 Tax=Clitoria ternatea TaxID=43366 RepID=A0AAN9JU24_CLITE
MEPPHVMLGGAEECHSSESGWTMYIGSPIEEDAHCVDEENDDDDDNNRDYDYDYEGTQADPEVESDDSMASDASSGPSHYGIINALGSGYDGFTHYQQKEEEEYCGKDKRATACKAKEKKVQKNDTVFINAKGKAPAVQNKLRETGNNTYV